MKIRFIEWGTPVGVVAGMLLLGLLMELRGQAGPDPGTDAVMRAKLAASQRMLAGIALADFRTVQTNAATLTTLSAQRGWAALQTPDYEMFTTRFRMASESLGEAASAKDMETLLQSYQELTRSCVGCHTYLRDRRPKEVPAKGP
jgi:cytochrome c556